MKSKQYNLAINTAWDINFGDEHLLPVSDLLVLSAPGYATIQIFMFNDWLTIREGDHIRFPSSIESLQIKSSVACSLTLLISTQPIFRKDLTGVVKGIVPESQHWLVPSNGADAWDQAAKLINQANADPDQWSKEVASANANIDVTAFQRTLDDGFAGILDSIVCDLTFALKAASATADVTANWQMKAHYAASWSPIMDDFTVADIGIAFHEYRFAGKVMSNGSGYSLAFGAIDIYPIDIRLRVRSNEGAPNGEVTAKVNGTSFVIAKRKLI